jgi:putative oxidoreductase
MPPSEHPLPPPARTGNTAFAMSLALLFIRVTLGWTFIYAGSQKAFGAFNGIGMEGFAKGLVHMGLPGFLPVTVWAYMAAYGELLGGISVLLGLLARAGAIPLICTMLVAIVHVTGPNGFGGSYDPVEKLKMGYAYNLNLIAMCTAILLAGPGLISLDALLFKRGLWAHGPQPLDNPVKRGP